MPEPAPAASVGSDIASDQPPVIVATEQLARSFAGPNGRVAAVADVSLTVRRGEFVALRGPSGCGKTTLLLTLGGLQRPDGGTLRIADEQPYALSPRNRARWRAHHIGFVFQQYFLVPYLSLIDNVRAAALAAPIDSNTADEIARARSVLERVGLDDRRNHLPAQISSGQAQRAAIARALFNQPPVVLADEPTGNLDADAAVQVLRLLADLAAQGTAIIMATHDDRAAGFAHRALEMDNGRLKHN